MKIGLKQKIIITTGIFTLILTLVLIFVILPSVKKILEIQKDLGFVENHLEEKYQKTQRLHRSLKELPEIKESTHPLQNTIVKTGDELFIITQLETLATLYNINQKIDIIYIADTKNSPQTNHKTLPHAYKISFINKATFEDHLKYLSALESMPIFLMIDSVQFNHNKSPASDRSVIAKFEGLVYAATK